MDFFFRKKSNDTKKCLKKKSLHKEFVKGKTVKG